jgi:hypothetical protein
MVLAILRENSNFLSWCSFYNKKNYVNVKQLSIKITEIKNKINIADQDEWEGQLGLNKEHMHQHVKEVHHIQTMYMTSSNDKK